MLIHKRLFPTCAMALLLALLFIHCGSDETTEPVDPLAGAALCLSDSSCALGAVCDTSSAIAVTNCGNSAVLSWTAGDNVAWLSLSVASGETPGALCLIADSNCTGAARAATVTVTTEDLTDEPVTIGVTQSTLGPTLCVSITDWEPTSQGEESPAISVTNCGSKASVAWEVTADEDWLTPSVDGGSTPGSFTITAEANEADESRTGTVSVTAEGAPEVSIVVTQPKKGPVLCVSLSQWQAYSLGEESGAISVTNCGDASSFDWEVTEDEDWLTLSEIGGSTSGSFTITADTNDTELSRTGTVTVTANEVPGSPWQITVEQSCVIALAGSYNNSGGAIGVYVSGTYAYLAAKSSGLQIVDIGYPANPTPAGSYDTPDECVAVYVSGVNAYAADRTSGLQIIDVSDSADPDSIGSYDTPGDAWGIFVSSHYAYVADAEGGFLIFDVSDLFTGPTLAGSYNTPDYSASNVFVSGDTAFVTDMSCGLLILDVSDPASPDSIGSYDTPGLACDVYVSGDYAYVADWDGGLQIIDVSTLSSPTLAGSCATPGYAHDVCVAGDFAYVANWESGLQIIDVSDPLSPAVAASYDMPDATSGVFVAGGYAYVANQPNGLFILKLGL